MTYVDQSDLAGTGASQGARMVGFKQAGSTTTRTVQDKLEEVVSVRDFGAIGDGSTNDTAAIQAAITAAGSLLTPGAIYLPRGVYNCTSSLNITAPIQRQLYI